MPLLQVRVNGKRVYPAYSNSFLNLRGQNTEMSLEIPEIKIEVVVKADFFILIDIPNAHFGGNTEGQCGELPDPLSYTLT